MVVVRCQARGPCRRRGAGPGAGGVTGVYAGTVQRLTAGGPAVSSGWPTAISPNLEALGSPVVTIPVSKVRWKQALGGSKF